METNNNSYNEETVCYCKQCLSLCIKEVPDIEGVYFCEECGNTDLAECTIDEWEKMYKERYGKEYLDRTPRVFKYN